MPIIISGPSPVISGITSVVLDPEEVAEGRTEFEINAGGIRIAVEGLDWGDSAIEAYMAEGARGSSPVDFRVPNRQITIPLLLGANSDDSDFEEARSDLAAKAALFQQEGGWLKRGEGFYADIVNATLKIPDKHGYEGYESDVVLTLEALPDFYSDESESALVSEATDPELVTLLGALAGNFPGRVRMVVAETDARARQGLIWALRSRHYSAALTAKCAYAAQALDPLDAAANATVASQAAVRHQNLSTAWTPVLGTDITASGAMTHTGTNRIWALAYSTSATPPQLRFVYDVGDMVLPEENAAVALPGANHWYFVDIGEARLDPSPLGAHRWRGQIQAKGAAGGENVSIARLYVLNVDEGYGVLRAPVNAGVGLDAFVSRDEFNHVAGGLVGETAPQGGVWAGMGDADDFQVETTGKTAQRAGSSDTGNWGRVDYLPVSLTASVAQVDVKITATAGGGDLHQGVVARRVDGTNFARVVLDPADQLLKAEKVIAGIPNQLGPYLPFRYALEEWMTIRVLVEATGRWHVWCFPQGSQPLEPALSGQDAVLATGGALASGNPGINDENSTSGTPTRSYDNFAAWVPEPDAVIHASRAAELSTDGMYRETTDGLSAGPISHVVDMLPRLPPAGLEGRPCELFLLPSDGDLDHLPHTPGGADLSVQTFSRASYIFPTV